MNRPDCECGTRVGWTEVIKWWPRKALCYACRIYRERHGEAR